MVEQTRITELDFKLALEAAASIEEEGK